MTGHTIGTREELLKREKEHTRRGDEIAQLRRDLPWVRVEKDYLFETDEGEKSLAELFDGRSQLLVYHFMFGPSYEAGCPVNSSIADSIDGVVPHVQARDATLLLVSQGRSRSSRDTNAAWAGASRGPRLRRATSTSTSASRARRNKAARLWR